MEPLPSLLPVPVGPFSVAKFSPIEHHLRDYQEPISLVTPPIFFSLVVPTYQEAKNIEKLIKILSGILDQALGDDYELIIVDDNSPDRTWEVAQSLIPNYPRLRVMCRQQERGLSTAVIRGWQVAQGQVLGVIDGDLQHPPETLLKMLREIEDGADMVLASRNAEGGGVSTWSLVRRFLSRGAQLLGLVILPEVVGRVSDPMSGYFMVRRSAIAGKVMNPLGYKISIEVLGRGNIGRISEVGYVFQERQEGESKVTYQQYIHYLLHLVRLRSDLWQLGRFIRFSIVGFSGVFVDMIILYLLHDPTTLGWDRRFSKVIASELAIVNNFTWNDFWTFRDLALHQTGWKYRIKRFIKFNLICLVGVVLNLLLLELFTTVFQIDYRIANLMAIALITLWNYWINLKLSWRVAIPEEEETPQPAKWE